MQKNIKTEQKAEESWYRADKNRYKRSLILLEIEFLSFKSFVLQVVK